MQINSALNNQSFKGAWCYTIHGASSKEAQEKLQHDLSSQFHDNAFLDSYYDYKTGDSRLLVITGPEYEDFKIQYNPLSLYSLWYGGLKLSKGYQDAVVKGVINNANTVQVEMRDIDILG